MKKKMIKYRTKLRSWGTVTKIDTYEVTAPEGLTNEEIDEIRGDKFKLVKTEWDDFVENDLDTTPPVYTPVEKKKKAKK